MYTCLQSFLLSRIQKANPNAIHDPHAVGSDQFCEINTTKEASSLLCNDVYAGTLGTSWLGGFDRLGAL